MGKCSDPTGDKENLNSKAAQLTILHSELPEGQQKLEKALSVAAQACQIADDEDKDIIEEEVILSSNSKLSRIHWYGELIILTLI